MLLQELHQIGAFAFQINKDPRLYRCLPGTLASAHSLLHVKSALVILALLGILGAAAALAVYGWQATAGVQMSIHGYIAMALGITFSIIVGCGLMALVFYSSRRGFDEPPDLNSHK
jgi:hypothetical protein